MPTKRLIEAVSPSSQCTVPSGLANPKNAGLHVREIARRANLNSKALMRELHSLRDAGRQVIYHLNQDCPIYDELRSILRKTTGLSAVLRSAPEPLTDQIEQAYICGSHARGDERPDNDIDLMIVGSVTLPELSSPLRKAGRSLHRVISTTLYTPEAYEQELQTGDSFVARVHNSKRLNLVGGDR